MFSFSKEDCMKKTVSVVFISIILITIISCDAIIPKGKPVIKEVTLGKIDFLNNLVVTADPQGNGPIEFTGDLKLNFTIQQNYNNQLFMKPFTQSVVCPYSNSQIPNVISMNCHIKYEEHIALDDASVTISVTPSWINFNCITREETIYLKDLNDQSELTWTIPISISVRPPNLLGAKGTLNAKLTITGSYQ
jgi:hypothetical protein